MICVCCGNPDSREEDSDNFSFFRGSYFCEFCLEEWMKYLFEHPKHKDRIDVVLVRWIARKRDELEKEMEEIGNEKNKRRIRKDVS